MSQKLRFWINPVSRHIPDRSPFRVTWSFLWATVSASVFLDLIGLYYSLTSVKGPLDPKRTSIVNVYLTVEQKLLGLVQSSFPVTCTSHLQGLVVSCVHAFVWACAAVLLIYSNTVWHILLSSEDSEIVEAWFLISAYSETGRGERHLDKICIIYCGRRLNRNRSWIIWKYLRRWNQCCLRMWQSLDGERIIHSPRTQWKALHLEPNTSIYWPQASYFTPLNLRFLICKVDLTKLTLHLSLGSANSSFPCLGPFGQTPSVAKQHFVGYWMEAAEERSVLVGLHEDSASILNESQEKAHLGQLLSHSPRELFWTMDSISFPSKSFAYFTVLKSWLRDLVKLHTSSDSFLLWVSTLGPTWWFLRACPNS